MYWHFRDPCCLHLLGDLSSGDIENVLNVSILVQSTSTQCHHAKTELSQYLITRFLRLDITYAEVKFCVIELTSIKSKGTMNGMLC